MSLKFERRAYLRNDTYYCKSTEIAEHMNKDQSVLLDILKDTEYILQEEDYFLINKEGLQKFHDYKLSLLKEDNHFSEKDKNLFTEVVVARAYISTLFIAKVLSEDKQFLKR